MPKLRRYCLSGLIDEPLTERHVQAIWYDIDLRPDNLETRGGEPVKVVHPGAWNLESGPDFTGAVLEIGRERRRVKGDVEVHISPSDWTCHGHAKDPAYGNVVAHVTWLGGPEPPDLPPNAVSIWLGKAKASEPGFSPEQIDVGAYPFSKLPVTDRPCHALIGKDPGISREILLEAGSLRIAAKARRLKTILAKRAGERMQVFYEETMNALGYKKNSKAFRRIAESVPYDAIASEPENAAAAFLAASGFVEWQRSGFRPNNSPDARLARAGEIFSTTGIMYLAEVASFGRKACAAMLHTLTSHGLMGRGRAAAVITNVILPFAIAEGRVDACPEWLPPEDISQPVRLMASRLFGRDHNPCALYASNGMLIQGLLHIFRNFCLQSHPDCGECELSRDSRRNTAENETEVKANAC